MKKSTGIIMLVVGLVVGFVLSNALSNKMVLSKEGAPLTAEQKAFTDASIDAYFAKHPEAAGKTNVEQLKAEIKANAPKNAPASSGSGKLGAMAGGGSNIICVNRVNGGWNNYLWTIHGWELLWSSDTGTCQGPVSN